MEREHDLAKWLAGDMGLEELRDFERSPEFATYEKIAKYTSELETPAFDEVAMYETIISREQQPPKVIRFHQTTFFRIAAAIVVLLGLTVTIAPNLSKTQASTDGQQLTFALPDDSEVILNAGSSAQYKTWNWSNNRAIELHGEAFFKVAKGKTFDVRTNLGTVTVVGTQFNVKARGARFEVECFEGKVRVAFGNREKFLGKGDVLVADNGNEIAAAPMGGVRPCWLDGELCFTAVPLSEIVAELERQYKIDIIQKDLTAEGLFTGKIPADNLEKSLAIVSKTFNFKFAIGKNTVTLYPDA
jgi:ferric-dicitrate binding protein FerR (iron transport regulator)